MDHTLTMAAWHSSSISTSGIAILQHHYTLTFRDSHCMFWEFPYAFSFGKFYVDFESWKYLCRQFLQKKKNTLLWNHIAWCLCTQDSLLCAPDYTKNRKVRDLLTGTPDSKDEGYNPDPGPEAIKGKSSVNKWRAIRMVWCPGKRGLSFGEHMRETGPVD